MIYYQIIFLYCVIKLESLSVKVKLPQLNMPCLLPKNCSITPVILVRINGSDIGWVGSSRTAEK